MTVRLSLKQRRAIIEYSPESCQESVSVFCRRIGVSRQTFYRIRQRHQTSSEGGWIAGSTAPLSPRRRFGTEVHDVVVSVRRDLAVQGFDCGAISVFYYICDHGLLPEQDCPSVSTIHRILTQAGLVVRSRQKRPRSSYQRFSRERVDELWQVDALDYLLWSDLQERVTIYQIIDDASRFDVGTKAFKSRENALDAIDALKLAFDTYGAPQQLLSDNGSAFNQLRTGVVGATEKFVISYGCEPISGLPGKPTTQGKNERAHQPLRRFLNARKPTSFHEVEQLLEQWRDYYNNQRRHQAFSPPMTPAQAREKLPEIARPLPPVDEDELAARLQRYSGRYSRYNTQAQAPGSILTFTHKPRLNISGHSVVLPAKFAHGQYRITRTEQQVSLHNPGTNECVLTMPLPLPDGLPRHVTLSRIPGSWTVYQYRAFTGRSSWETRNDLPRSAPQVPTEVTIKNNRVAVCGHRVGLASQFNGMRLTRIVDDKHYLLVDPTTGEVMVDIPLPIDSSLPRCVPLHRIEGAKAKWKTRKYAENPQNH